MSLQSEIPAGTSNSDNNIPQPATPDTDNHEDDNQSSASSEDIAPSPKRQNKKRTPPANAIETLRKSTRNRQSALSHAFGNLVSLTLSTMKRKKPIKFQIDSPPDKRDTDNYPSLKSLIQEICFTEKTPQYRACVKLIEAISPKNKTGVTEVVDLTSPPIEDDATADTNNENLFVNTIACQESGMDQNKKNNDDEEHESQGKKLPNMTYKQKNDVEKSYRDYKTQTCQSLRGL